MCVKNEYEIDLNYYVNDTSAESKTSRSLNTSCPTSGHRIYKIFLDNKYGKVIKF